MTGTRDPQQDGSIHAMLRDSGLEASAELRGSLEALRSLVPDQAPAPRADLAALLTAGAPGSGADGSPAAGTVPTTAGTALPVAPSAPEPIDDALPAVVSSLAARRGLKRRLAIVGGAVVGAMTLGAGAVAASSEDFRESVNHTVGVIFQPSGETPDVAPKPADPSPTDIPASPAPSNAAGATAQPTAEDAPDAPGTVTGAPQKPTATPPAVGRGGVLPTPPRRPVTPGVPGLPGRGEDRVVPAKPLPEPTLPLELPTLPAS